MSEKKNFQNNDDNNNLNKIISISLQNERQVKKIFNNLFFFSF